MLTILMFRYYPTQSHVFRTITSLILAEEKSTAQDTRQKSK